eukprot:scaffold127242_cov25-Tisochrysis_lutea.AAC.3
MGKARASRYGAAAVAGQRLDPMTAGRCPGYSCSCADQSQRARRARPCVAANATLHAAPGYRGTPRPYAAPQRASERAAAKWHAVANWVEVVARARHPGAPTARWAAVKPARIA